MIQGYSPNVFWGSGWGVFLGVILFFILVALWLGALYLLTRLIARRWDPPVWAFFLVFFGGMVGAVWSSSGLSALLGSHGEADSLSLIGTQEEPLLLAGFSWPAKYGRGSKRSLFRLSDGAFLRDLDKEDRYIAGWVGFRSDEETVELIDLRTGKVLLNGREELSRVAEGQKYLIKHPGGSVTVLLQNGEERVIDLYSLLPEGQRPSDEIDQNIKSEETCQAHMRENPFSGREIKGLSERLLRSDIVAKYEGSSARQVCRFPLGGAEGAALALHRATAFGEGAVLLSAIKEDQDKPLWSLDLSVLLGDDIEASVYGVSVGEGCLRFWLLHNKRGLYDACVDPSGGALREARAIF